MSSADGDRRRDAVHVAPVLPPRVRHFARALDEEGRLRTLVTGYVYQPESWFERACSWTDAVVGDRLIPLLRRRAFQEIVPELCRRRCVRAVVSYFGQRVARGPAARTRREDAGFAAIDRFAASRVIDESTRLVLGREDGCLASFERARKMGATTVYDLPTAYHATTRAIVEREEELFPGVSTMPPAKTVFDPVRIRRKQRELGAAHHLVVGSAFVRNSLVEHGFDPQRITVLPSGCDESWLASPPHPGRSRSTNVVLHVAHLSLRKGTHRLLRAWKRLGAHRHFRLRLVGDMFLSPRFLSDYRGCYEHVGRLARDALHAQYASAYLFALPAAAEGFAAVILEALSCGVPIVVSRNSGAEGFIEPGRQGLLHEFGDEDALCGQLDRLLSRPAERAAMACEARRLAARWTWRDYRRRFRDLLVRMEGAFPCAVSSAV